MLEVVDWIPWEGTKEENLSQEAEQAIIDSIRKNGYCFGGAYHQSGKKGAPLFSDGKTRTYSLRGWGRVMATAWDVCDESGEPDYMAFYMMCTPQQLRLKTPEEV